EPARVEARGRLGAGTTGRRRSARALVVPTRRRLAAHAVGRNEDELTGRTLYFGEGVADVGRRVPDGEHESEITAGAADVFFLSRSETHALGANHVATREVSPVGAEDGSRRGATAGIRRKPGGNGADAGGRVGGVDLAREQGVPLARQSVLPGG